MTLEQYNSGTDEARQALAGCCGSEGWLNGMLDSRPVASFEELHKHALEVWYRKCSRIDWIDAFRHHPRIGDIDSLRQKYANSEAGAEQGQVESASEEILAALADANSSYELQFGHIFIVCATGKSAEEMLQLIYARLPNHPDDEIGVAMGEQAKITALRLAKLFDHDVRQVMGRSKITTHILDTALGKPAKGLGVTLLKRNPNAWSVITEGVSDADGRVEDLLPWGKTIPPATYRLAFGTGAYHDATGTESFYPAVDIQFEIKDESHYHVPLLLNPFGYSTYRGT